MRLIIEPTPTWWQTTNDFFLWHYFYYRTGGFDLKRYTCEHDCVVCLTNFVCLPVLYRRFHFCTRLGMCSELLPSIKPTKLFLVVDRIIFVVRLATTCFTLWRDISRLLRMKAPHALSQHHSMGDVALTSVLMMTRYRRGVFYWTRMMHACWVSLRKP